MMNYVYHLFFGFASPNHENKIYKILDFLELFFIWRPLILRPTDSTQAINKLIKKWCIIFNKNALHQAVWGQTTANTFCTVY